MTAELSQFLSRFAEPMLGAGEVHVGAPIAPRVLAEWRRSLLTAPLARLADLRTQDMATLVVDPPSLETSEVELRLLIAVHNLLFLSHPESDGVFTTRAQRTRVAVSIVGLLRLPAPRTRAELLGRHTIVGRALTLERRDVDLRWWTGSRHFRGQKVPGRLKAWPKLRAVREQARRVAFWDIVTDEATPAVAELLAQSPLSDLLVPSRAHPRFAFTQRHLPVLADRDLARAVCYRLVPDLPVHAEALGRALRTLLEAPPEGALAPCLQFLVHLHWLYSIGKPQLPADPEGAAEEFWALPALLAEVAPALGEPPGLADDVPVANAFWAYRARCLVLAGPEAASKLKPLLQPVRKP